MRMGILLKNLGANQLAYYAIKNNNLYLDIDPTLDCIFFYENDSKPCFPMNFASMQMYEAFGYNGNMISTCLSTTHKMINFPASSNKFFYIWDLEWLRMGQKYYRDLYDIYCNNNIKLIARSNRHKDIIEDCWNVKVAGVVEDCNMSELIKIVSNYGNN